MPLFPVSRCVCACTLGVLLLFGLLVSSPVQARSRVKSQPSIEGLHAFDVVGGGSRSGTWGLRVQGGYPWQSLQVQVGLPGTWTPILELNSALFQRNQFLGGVALRWIDGRHFRLTGEVLLGYLFQFGELAQQGAVLNFRLRAMYRWSRLAVFLRIDTNNTLLINRKVLDTEQGTETSTSYGFRCSPWASAGVAFRLTERISIDLEFAWPWIDAPTIPIPGLSVGLHIAFPS